MAASITIPTDFTAGHLMVDSDVRQYRTAIQQISTLLGDSASFTPAWTSTGTAPSLGNATNVGRSATLNGVVFFMMELFFGSTSTFGTGSYRFSLPVAAIDPATGACIGSAIMLKSGVAYHIGQLFLVTSTTYTIIEEGDTGSGITPTTPFTFAAGDGIMTRGHYFKA